MLSLIQFLRGDFRGALTTATGSTTQLFVKAPQELGRYLDELKVPRWRQRVMFEHRIVTVIRPATDGNLTALPTVGRATNLVEGDRVELNTSHPAYVAQLDEYARQATDYVLVADLDVAHPFIAAEIAIHQRVGAEVFDHSDTGPELTLEQFITNVGTGSATRPPRDLQIVSHAYFTGELLFSPTLAAAGAGKVLKWETIDSAGEALRLPDSYLEPRVAEPPNLIIRACEFGRARPMLEKLRAVLNPRLRVFAPSYYLGAVAVTRDEVFGDYLEFMAKPCFVHSPTELSRDEVIHALHGQGDSDPNGQSIDLARWNALVPALPWKPPEDDAGWLMPQKVDVTLPARNLPGRGPAPAQRASIACGGLYRFPFRISGSLSTTATEAQFNADPTGTLKSAIAAVSDTTNKWHPSHPFPMWKRAHFLNADDFVDGMDWAVRGTLSYTAPGKIEGLGWGVKYCVLVPLLEPSGRPYRDRKLVVNYYPDGATTPHPNDLAITSPHWASIP